MPRSTSLRRTPSIGAPIGPGSLVSSCRQRPTDRGGAGPSTADAPGLLAESARDHPRRLRRRHAASGNLRERRPGRAAPSSTITRMPRGADPVHIHVRTRPANARAIMSLVAPRTQVARNCPYMEPASTRKTPPWRTQGRNAPSPRAAALHARERAHRPPASAWRARRTRWGGPCRPLRSRRRLAHRAG